MASRGGSHQTVPQELRSESQQAYQRPIGPARRGRTAPTRRSTALHKLGPCFSFLFFFNVQSGRKQVPPSKLWMPKILRKRKLWREAAAGQGPPPTFPIAP